MNRFNFRAFKQFWSLAKQYWLGEEKKGALSLLAFLFILLVVYTQLSVLLNQQQGNIISTLSQKERRPILEYDSNFLYYPGYLCSHVCWISLRSRHIG